MNRTVELVLNSLVVEYRVIGALMLREMYSVYGNTSLGYLWVLLQTFINIGIFWVIREYMGVPEPHGMSVAMFLISGFCVWNVISQTITKSLKVVSGSTSLLTFPQVTELDIILARFLVICATQAVVAIILVAVAIAIGQGVRVYSWGMIISIMIICPFLALGLGLTLTSFSVIWPVLGRLVPIVIRMLFFVSGIFFSANTFSQGIAELLLYNPIFQLIELLRNGIYSGYPSDKCSWTYLILLTLALLALGSIMERYVRSRRNRIK